MYDVPSFRHMRTCEPEISNLDVNEDTNIAYCVFLQTCLNRSELDLSWTTSLSEVSDMMEFQLVLESKKSSYVM